MIVRKALGGLKRQRVQLVIDRVLIEDHHHDVVVKPFEGLCSPRLLRATPA
jgi:hypothetical protein